MTSGVNQNRFPAHLETLAKELNIEFKTEELSEAQDLCFTDVWDTFLQKKWDLIDSQKDALTKLVNSLGDTLLIYSIKHDESEIFTKLLDKEICVSSKDKEGNLPIHIAAKLGLLKFIQKLFEHNLTDKKNLKLQTPLHLAASIGQETIVRKLLQMMPILTENLICRLSSFCPLIRKKLLELLRIVSKKPFHKIFQIFSGIDSKASTCLN